MSSFCLMVFFEEKGTESDTKTIRIIHSVLFSYMIVHVRCTVENLEDIIRY